MEKKRGKAWTPLECQIAARMYREVTAEYGAHERFLFRIAKELGRPHAGVRGRLRQYGLDFGEGKARNRQALRQAEKVAGFRSPRGVKSHQVHGIYIPEHVLEDRERRYQLNSASTTAALLGDPLPGYSALDRQR